MNYDCSAINDGCELIEKIIKDCSEYLFNST